MGAHGFRLGHVRNPKERKDGAERLQAHYMQESFEGCFKGDKGEGDLTYLRNYDT